MKERTKLRSSSCSSVNAKFMMSTFESAADPRAGAKLTDCCSNSWRSTHIELRTPKYTFAYSLVMDEPERTGAAVDQAPTLGVRSDLAKHLKRAEAGERIIVTVDNRAVAQLGPVVANSHPSLGELIAAGLVEPPRRRDRPDPPPADTLATGLTPDRVLRELRGR